MGDFSVMQGLVLVSQRLVLLLKEEGSPSFPLRRAEWGFLLNLSSPSRQTLPVKTENQCPVEKQRPHPADHFPGRIQHRTDLFDTFHSNAFFTCEKVTCENCGTQTTNLNLACHKKSCSAGTMCCTQSPTFSR